VERQVSVRDGNVKGVGWMQREIPPPHTHFFFKNLRHVGFENNNVRALAVVIHRTFYGSIDRNESHVHWAHTFIRLLTELQAYVRKFHATGLVWNPKVKRRREIATK